MADYLIVWVDYAFDQYLALDQQIGTQLNDRLRLLAQLPTGGGQYDPATDHWTAEFNDGRGLVVYIVSDQHRRVVILRVLHFS